MNIEQYACASRKMKYDYFDSMEMVTGLVYFGGKSKIGKYILNRIYEMQLYRYLHTGIDVADTFVDAFTGGGKMALTVAKTGLFKRVVMNDFDYCVWAYYKSIQDHPAALYHLIKCMGEIIKKEIGFIDNVVNPVIRSGYKCKDSFEKDLKDEALKDEAFMIIAGACEYWKTSSSFSGTTGSDDNMLATRIADTGDVSYIDELIDKAHERIRSLNEIMSRSGCEFVILNQSYDEVVDNHEKYGINTDSVIWYFDPPYHQATLACGAPADYNCTFDFEATRNMTGRLKEMYWFLKSDYDPYGVLNKAGGFCYNGVYHEYSEFAYDFIGLEDYNNGFFRDVLGNFEKTSAGGDLAKSLGEEVLWCRYGKDSTGWKDFVGFDDNRKGEYDQKAKEYKNLRKRDNTLKCE